MMGLTYMIAYEVCPKCLRLSIVSRAFRGTVVKTATQITNVPPGTLLSTTRIFLKMKTTVFNLVPRTAS